MRPLADEIRPQTLDQVAGQKHLLGPGALLRRLIEGEHYRLPVVSYQEITPEISVQPVNRIRL